jgi:uncharacterized membrane protein YidH (DUF202 family)
MLDMPAPPIDRNREDGTTVLLRTGFSVIAVGMAAAALVVFVLGGIGPQGPHSNPGWLCVIIFLMSTPFGVLLAALGVAKWFRNRALSRQSTR